MFVTVIPLEDPATVNDDPELADIESISVPKLALLVEFISIA